MDVNHLTLTLMYTAFGMLVFGLAFVAIVRLVPFSVRKEIEEDQNTALAIVMGSVIVGLAIVVSSALQG